MIVSATGCDRRPMTTRRSKTEDAARLLQQRREINDQDVFLSHLTREEALQIASTIRGQSPSSDPLGSAQQRDTKVQSEQPSLSGAELPKSYKDLRNHALACTRCGLAESRKNVVFSDGVEDASVMVVGEAPGANEDKTGLPFVGAAGKFLDLLLATVDLSRERNTYICNVLKCRPPGNRDPKPDEIKSCSPFLTRQIQLIQPEALLAVGSFAGRLLTGQEKTALGRIRGEVHSYQGVPLIVTYHPAALLRNPKWTFAFWEDLQLLRQVLNSG